MTFHVNHVANDSFKMSSLIFSEKVQIKKSESRLQLLVIGDFRAKTILFVQENIFCGYSLENICCG